MRGGKERRPCRRSSQGRPRSGRSEGGMAWKGRCAVLLANHEERMRGLESVWTGVGAGRWRIVTKRWCEEREGCVALSAQPPPTALLPSSVSPPVFALLAPLLLSHVRPEEAHPPAGPVSGSWLPSSRSMACRLSLSPFSSLPFFLICSRASAALLPSLHQCPRREAGPAHQDGGRHPVA